MKTKSKKTSATKKKPAPASEKELAYGVNQILTGQDEILKRLERIESFLAIKGTRGSKK